MTDEDAEATSAASALSLLLDLGPLLAPRLVRELSGRPLALCASDIERTEARTGEWLGIRRMSGPAAGLSIDDEEGLLHAWRSGVTELRTGHRRAVGPDDGCARHPDRLVFDLDAGPGAPWPMVLEVAALLRASLESMGLVSLLKTSGSRGLHLVLPIAPVWPAAALVGIAEAAVGLWSRRFPRRIASHAGPTPGRVNIAPRCNRAGATLVAAYSLRARSPWGVSMPVRWNELSEISAGDHWTLATLPARLLELGDFDPWAGHTGLAQSLDPMVRGLGLPTDRQAVDARR